MSTQVPQPTGRSGSTSHDDPTLGALVTQLSEQSSQLIRDELRLAQAELGAKAKHAGIGIGAFGGAGLLALYGVGLLLAAAVLGLATALDPWLAALIVAVVVLVVAAIAALVGKKQVTEATPVVPERAVANAKLDVATIKGEHR